MSAEIRQRILEAQTHFGLPSPALVEKDLHVVAAIRALAAIEAAPFSFVFGGGTSLARAHKFIRRMSEDIDFKIVLLPGNEGLKSSALKRELSVLKHAVSAALAAAGFPLEEKNAAHVQARNQNQYIVYQLPYVGEFALGEGMRPTIQVELTLDPLLLSPVTLPVSSFLAEAFQEPPEVPGIACVSVMETAAEKLVALTRRTAMELAGIGKEKDHTLVRHLYDLQCLRHRLSVEEIGGLVRTIMVEDAKDYGNQFPAYRADPAAQSRLALHALSTDPGYAAQYDEFVRNMVYGDEVPEFHPCIATTSELLHSAGI